MINNLIKKYNYIFFIISINLLINLKAHANNFNLLQIANLNDPWGMSFINNNEIIISEKGGKIKIVNIENLKITEISHNLNFIEHGQGGLLDIIYQKKKCLDFLH